MAKQSNGIVFGLGTLIPIITAFVLCGIAFATVRATALENRARIERQERHGEQQEIYAEETREKIHRIDINVAKLVTQMSIHAAPEGD